MYRQEQIKPYEGTGDKGKLVEEMFDNIAPTYDTLNHRLSWDIDKGWRKKAIRRLAPFSPKKMLDIATGTGDFAILAAQMLHPDQLIGADISEGMMEIGRQKVKQLGLENTISFAKEDCLNLSFQDESFDAVTAAFGIRNFQNLDQGQLTDRYLNGIPEDSRIRKDGRFLKESVLTPERLDQIRRLNDLAAQRGEKLADMALGWLLQHKEVTSVLIGASKPQQILDNVKAIHCAPFTAEELRLIDEISK